MSETRKMTKAHVTIDDAARGRFLGDYRFDPTKALNLGCGNDYIDGWINLDGDPHVKADVHCELDSKDVHLPFEDNSLDLICCFHILEHIRHLPELKRELHRVLKPNAFIFIVVPHYLSHDAWGDDTHCRAFSLHSFYVTFWPGFSSNYNYQEVTIGNPILKDEELYEDNFHNIFGGLKLKWIFVSRHKEDPTKTPA